MLPPYHEAMRSAPPRSPGSKSRLRIWIARAPSTSKRGAARGSRRRPDPAGAHPRRRAGDHGAAFLTASARIEKRS